MNKIKINIFTRKPLKTNYSIEGYISMILKQLSSEFDFKVIEMPFHSTGIINKVLNIIYCFFKQNSSINHVIGDIHYVNLFFNKKNSLLTIHDLIPLERFTGFKFMIFKYFWLKLPIYKSKKVLLISESTLGEVYKHHNQMFNFDITYPMSKLNLKKDTKVFNKLCPTILQVGTKSNKNIARLIKSLKGISCRLIIIGELGIHDLSLLNRCQIKYLSKNNISDSELVKYYKDCDILSFVSTYEGFGLPIIEANTIGRVVISSNIYSMREVGKESAFLVDPYDVASIRNGFIKIINDKQLRNNLIMNGFNNAQKYSLKSITETLSSIYKNF